MFDKELICAVALNRILPYNPGIANALYKHCGSFSTIFCLTARELESVFGKKRKFIGEICSGKSIHDAEKELSQLSASGVKAIHRNHEGYPELLKECSDSPLVIYVNGNIDLKRQYFLSVVGTRSSSSYGENSCNRIMKELARTSLNPVIVSGLAYGIDITVHKAALDNGLDTVAVLPCGPDRVYPSAHYSTAMRISRQGGLITEFSRDTPLFKLNFIQRNRIIAGLSHATIVVESGIKGGALSTAELAQSYSREVFALPGRIGDIKSMGCNFLISKNIANIFISTEDFLYYMRWIEEKSGKMDEPCLFETLKSEKEKIFVALKKNSGLNRDALLHITGLNIKILSTALLEMEMDGVISLLPGGRYSLEL